MPMSIARRIASSLSVIAIIIIAFTPNLIHSGYHFDKALHAFGFCFISCFIALRPKPFRVMVDYIVILIIIGVGIELCQALSPTRSAEIGDIGANLFGIFYGTLLGYALRHKIVWCATFMAMFMVCMLIISLQFPQYQARLTIQNNNVINAADVETFTAGLTSRETIGTILGPLDLNYRQEFNPDRYDPMPLTLMTYEYARSMIKPQTTEERMVDQIKIKFLITILDDGIVQMEYSEKHPDLARDVLTALGDLYVDATNAQYIQTAEIPPQIIPKNILTPLGYAFIFSFLISWAIHMFAHAHITPSKT